MPTNDLIRVLLELRETTGTGDGIRYSMPPRALCPGRYIRAGNRQDFFTGVDLHRPFEWTAGNRRLSNSGPDRGTIDSDSRRKTQAQGVFQCLPAPLVQPVERIRQSQTNRLSLSWVIPGTVYLFRFWWLAAGAFGGQWLTRY